MKRLLSDCCQAAWQKSNELANVLLRLQHELDNKVAALAIDAAAKALDTHSHDISHKPHADAVPSKSITERGYVECVRNTIRLAEQMVRESRCVRESMGRVRRAAQDSLRAQRHAVGHVLRRRAFDTQRARNEMQWQLDELEREMAATESEIGRLQLALDDKRPPQQVAESRLALRQRRPLLELVRDQATDGLLEELQRVRSSREQLQQRLHDALSIHRGMCGHRQRLECELRRKQQALEAELSLLDTRRPLERPATQHERNVACADMTQQLAPLI